MVHTLLTSGWAHVAIAGGLGACMREIAAGLFLVLGLAFKALESHPNAYVTPGMEETAKAELLTDIAQDAAKAAHTTNVAVTVTSAPALAPATKLQSQKDAPQYNQD